MNSHNLYKLKNDIKCIVLNNTVIQTILDSFNKSNIKTIKTIKKQVNIMKTNKIQIKKDLNENKLIMIMNKLSNNNINELLIEYINNILVDDEEKYNIILTELFYKMLKDIKFIEIYINFSLKIFSLEQFRLKLYPIVFVDLIKETLFTSSDEAVKSGCFEIIKQLNKVGFFNDNIINFISNSVFTQFSYIDIYNWFNSFPKDYIQKYKTEIINKINICEEQNMNREQILLSSLLEKVSSLEVQEVISQEITDEFKTLVDNILEEYNYLKSTDEIEEFIKTECIDINQKNIFCKEFINFIINSTVDLSLIDILIKKKILFKSNISKGLVLYLNENNILKSDERYNNVIEILKYMKDNNITKNIEYLFKKYRVKLYYNN
jgi:hypothetical protein